MTTMLRRLLPMFLLATTTAGAQTLLDPAFGVRGTARVPAPMRTGSFDRAGSVVIDETGRIWLSRSGLHADEIHSRVERRLANGELDQGFGREGAQEVRGSDGTRGQLLDIEPIGSSLESIALVINGDNNCVLQHWQADGSIDRSFGDHGSRFVGYSRCGDVALVDGGLLVLSRSSVAGEPAYVRRYDLDGAPVPTFAGDGQLELVGAGAGADPVRLLVSGASAYALVTSPGPRPAVGRFDALSGALDANWGSAGTWVATDPFASDEATGLALDDANVVVASSRGTRVRRLTALGQPDPAYGGDNGCAVPGVSGFDVQSTGDVIVASGGRYLLPSRFADAPLQPSSRMQLGFVGLAATACALDAGYGSGGYALAATPELDALQLHVAHARAGGDRVVLSFDALDYLGGTNDQDATVVAMSTAAVLVPFGSRRLLRSDGDVDPWDGGGFDAFALDDGYLIAGVAHRGEADRASVVAARIRSNGRIDTGYGIGGYVWLDGSDEPRSDFSLPGAFGASSDGAALAVANTSPGPCVVTVRRVTPNGASVTAFGLGGIVDIALATCAYPVAVRMEAGGGVLMLLDLAGTPSSFRLVRLLGNGSFDPSFGAGGLGPVVPNVVADDLVVTPSGYFVAGRTRSVFPEGIVVHGFATSGTPLPGFGSGGRAFRQQNALGPIDATVQDDGLLVAVQGEMSANSCVVARVDSSGTWVGAFGVGGTTGLGCRGGAALTSVPDGVFVATTASSTAPIPLGVTRLLTNGTVDTAFGANGTLLAADGEVSMKRGYASTSDSLGSLMVASDGLGWWLTRIRPANDERISLDGFE